MPESNRRFLVMADHYMVEPTACSRAAGWGKGQVENQVQTIRGRFFQPRLRFASIEELNGWLEAECLRWAVMQAHPKPGSSRDDRPRSGKARQPACRLQAFSFALEHRAEKWEPVFCTML